MDPQVHPSPALQVNDLALQLWSEELRREEEVDALKREAEGLRAKVAALEARHAEDRAKWRAEFRAQEAKIGRLFAERNAAQRQASTCRQAKEHLQALEVQRGAIVRRLITEVREGEHMDVELVTRELAAAFRLSYT